MEDTGVEYEPKGIEYAALDAINEGFEANEHGMPVTSNPYAAGTWLYTAWADGWGTQQAMREA